MCFAEPHILPPTTNQMAYASDNERSSSVPVDRCYQVKCSKCGKTTWAGCGLHAEAVMKDVAEDDKCSCARE
ncbi:hypothetical protein Moror_3410 [Moniliophthora roreri MCA 2997]|uniref:Uncharacterized protein n=1 Tax=Moniliophthora roreri (strain MCA 2997) TaxID=1381753 RepID=V2WJ67_MONRO|nr:hypothetical protein Moror_3410 [Moniliophthora roreri MCA 2997]